MMTQNDAWFSNLNNAIILTPNRRLSSALHLLYREEQVKQGMMHWETPVILPIDKWFNSLYSLSLLQDDANFPLLLKEEQANFLWKDIVAKHPLLQDLIQTIATANLLRTAYELLILWQVKLTPQDCGDYQDYLILLECIEKYEHLCQENNWIDHTFLPTYLLNALTKYSQFKTNIPERIYLAGFNEVPPLINSFFEALKKLNTQVLNLNLNKQAAAPKVIEFKDDLQEYRAAATFAKKMLAENNKTRLAFIVPNLSLVRDQVKKVFTEVFFQENQFNYDENIIPFNISAGAPLSTFKIVSIALHLLSLNYNHVSYDQFTIILNTTLIGDYREMKARQNYAFLLKKWNIEQINLNTDSQYSLIKYCPLLHKRMTNAIKIIASYQLKEPINKWVDCFEALLGCYGFPGEISLESESYQIIEAFLQLLTKLSALQILTRKLNFQEALSLLKEMADEAIFQPKSPVTSIQILGSLEALGIPFDYIWLSGLDDLTWPQKPKPHPFIPKKLQQVYQMPHATSLREYQYCHDLMEQFKKSSKYFICSYAKSKDQLERYMSPLLYEYEPISEKTLQLSYSTSNFDKLIQSKKLEYFNDDKGAAIIGSTIKGGTYAIKTQSHCPFKAFTEWRLFAKSYDKPITSFNRLERGLLLHHIMNLIWQEIKSQETLLNLSDKALNFLILKFIKQTITKYARGKSKSIAYLKLETKRLFKLIKRFLMLEMTRPPFTVVSSEEKMNAKVANLEFSLRIDRIDQLATGERLVIDYKSSEQKLDWYNDRPSDPQLLMYAMTQNPIGFAYAELHSKEVAFSGLAKENINIKGIKEIKKDLIWDDQFIKWEQQIALLCHEFAEGIANVNPQNKATCQTCVHSGFCRIQEKIEC